MSLTVDDLFATPDHYLHSFDGEAALFRPMDRAAYRRSIFLDHRISPASDHTMALPVRTLTPLKALAKPIAWIFHMAHCGSTLLARALDDPAASLVLREPLALRQLSLQPDAGRLRLVLAMLGKRYRAGAPTLVKANVPVNFLAPQLASADGNASAILLYLPLRAYLLAILRNDQHRAWLRNVTGQLSHHLGDLSSKSDAERAAALWLAQTEAFVRILAAMPNARALDAELFFENSVPVLQAAALHLGVPIATRTLRETVAGPLFSTYSKNPSLTFDNATRIARIAAVELTLTPEIAAAEAWINKHSAATSPEVELVQRSLIR